MKRLLLGAAAAIAICIGNSAFAADLGVAPVYKAPPAPPPVTSWTGFYIGANAGYGWAHESSTRITPGSAAFPPGFASSGNQNGGLFGGQAGVDVQFNQFVLGVVADADWANLTGQTIDIGVGPLDRTTSNTGIKSLVDVGGRAGFAWNSFLAYVKGGGAWERIDLSSATVSPAGIGLTSTSGSVTRSGWFIGAGGEYKFIPTASLFLEYDHYDFGSATETRNIVASAVAAFPPGAPISNNVSRQTDVVKIGVNWRPNFWMFGGK